jgi:C-terminal processing protease CtpA/Prc
MKRSAFIILLFASLTAYPQTFTTQQYKEDFTFYWETINNNYCYFEKKQIDWASLREVYSRQIDTITSRESFISTLENAIYELYDHHCSLRTRNYNSRRLVPTAADIWAAYESEKPIIKEVRKDFGAEKVGITAGMEVIAVNNVPVNEAIKPFLSHTVNMESKSFALRLLLAGDHVTKRKITLKKNNTVLDFYPDQDSLILENVQYPSKIESKEFDRIGYIKINNFLFENELIPLFDSVLNRMLQKKAIIIDMRETPSGGNTTVARAILSRFISEEQFYQKHELYAEEKEFGVKRSWEEIVSPRGITYAGSLVILADHWTGSIAEGITIGFDGMKRAAVIGTSLARLNGAVESFEMPNSKIGFNIATERLYHINGLPRELYKPTIEVNVSGQKPGEDGDIILKTAIEYLKHQLTRGNGG